MDHGGMDHGGMGHGHDGMDGGHGGGMDDMCSMSMLFTWDTTNLCIIFKWWHVRSTLGLVASLLAVVALGVGFEAMRAVSRRYELAVERRVAGAPSPRNEPPAETTPFLWTGRARPEISRAAHVTKAVLYAVQNFYAFMLMLVFMTYNGWVMVAVSLGAFLGYLLFGESTSATKDNACH
jgi:copper transporter 1